jgi:chromosomal replication initiation ATPase DnaA
MATLSIAQGEWIKRLEQAGILADVERIAEAFQIRVQTLGTSNRTKRVAQARCFLYAWLKVARGWSWKEIGALCGRDHTTCLNGSQTRFRRVRAPVVTP